MPTGSPAMPGPIGPEVAARIARVIDLLRPAIQADGGDIELVQATADGTVYVRFLGACVGCPSSDITLHVGIERNLQQHVPEVRRVEVVQ